MTASAMPLYLRALGFLELSVGNAPAAARHLAGALEIAERFGIHEPRSTASTPI